MIKKYSVCLGAVCLMGSLATPNRLEAQIVVSDDFNDNSINSSVWAQSIVGSGPSIQEVNQRLEIAFPATSTGIADEIGVDLHTKNSFPGDFDARADFNLLNWPAQSEVRIGVKLTAPWVAMERASLTLGEQYLSQFYDGNWSASTSHTQGKLRLARTGSTYAGYYWDNTSSSWILFDTGTGPSGAVNIALGVWSHDSIFKDKEVTVAFDNFELTAVPEPQHYLLFSSCFLAGLALTRNRLHKIRC